jgi:hypothetical protein
VAAGATGLGRTSTIVGNLGGSVFVAAGPGFVSIRRHESHWDSSFALLAIRGRTSELSTPRMVTARTSASRSPCVDPIRVETCCVRVSIACTRAAAAAIMLFRKSAGRPKSVKIPEWGLTVFAIAVTAVCIWSGVQRGRGILSDLSASTFDKAAMSRIG